LNQISISNFLPRLFSRQGVLGLISYFFSPFSAKKRVKILRKEIFFIIQNFSIETFLKEKSFSLGKFQGKRKVKIGP